MTREWRGILSRYGQSVTLRQGEKAVQLRALVQPVLEESRPQAEPTPWAWGDRSAFCIWVRRSTPWAGTPWWSGRGSGSGSDGPTWRAERSVPTGGRCSVPEMR